VNPCEDLSQYAYGAWIKNNPIPSDQPRWGRFTELADWNREVLHEILEESARPDPARDSPTQNVGDYYAACMEVAVTDAKRAVPLQPEARPHS
jgi:endothelin-converting enzyme/putative endopeptidase